MWGKIEHFLEVVWRWFERLPKVVTGIAAVLAIIAWFKDLPIVWIVVASVSTAALVVVATVRWISQRNASKVRPYLNGPIAELSHAVWMIGHRSAWGRWYSAQILAGTGKINEIDLRHAVASVVSDEVMNGALTISGRPSGGLDYETIPRDHWRLAHISIETDVATIWKAMAKPRHNVDPDRISRLLSYDSLTVDPIEVAKLWPKKDRLTDAEKKKLLKIARGKGVDPDLIKGLS